MLGDVHSVLHITLHSVPINSWSGWNGVVVVGRGLIWVERVVGVLRDPVSRVTVGPVGLIWIFVWVPCRTGT